MMRFLGLILAIVGGAATLWGGYHTLLGESNAHLPLTRDFSLTAMHVGLVGVLVLTLGLIWVRD